MYFKLYLYTKNIKVVFGYFYIYYNYFKNVQISKKICFLQFIIYKIIFKYPFILTISFLV